MSAAYIPFGTSVVPPYFRGAVAYDAVLVDLLSGQIGFAANKASLWPPEAPELEASDRLAAVAASPTSPRANPKACDRLEAQDLSVDRPGAWATQSTPRT